MILPVLFAQPSSPDKDKVALDDAQLQDKIPEGLQNVALDDSQLQDAIPKGLQKVELDLDDALFLEFEDDEPEATEQPPEEPAALPQEEEEKREKHFWHDNRVVFGGGGLLLLLIIGAVAAYMFLSPPAGSDEEASENASLKSTAAALVAKPEQTPTSAITGADPNLLPVYNVSLDPFHIEFIHGGRVRFLTCRIYLTEMSKPTQNELRERDTEIRDVIYSYFKTVDFSVVEQGHNATALTTGLQAAVNARVRNGRIGGVILDEFVVR